MSTASSLRTFLDGQISSRPIEREIIERIANALRDAGTPIVKIWDSEEWTEVSTNQSILDVAFNLDELIVYTADSAGVFLVMGEKWDMLNDYNVSLESALEPVNVWINERMDSE